MQIQDKLTTQKNLTYMFSKGRYNFPVAKTFEMEHLKELEKQRDKYFYELNQRHNERLKNLSNHYV